MTTGSTADVVVVGAGPTGLTLAYELALAGIGTLVLDKLPQRIEQVKGGGIQPRTAELLESRGLLEPLLDRVVPGDPVGGHFGALPVPLDCTPWRTRHPHAVPVAQWALEEILEERAVAAGARVVRGAAVSTVTPDDAGVVVRAGDARVRARYVVACDGAHSTVRKLLALPFPGRPGTHRAVLADIRLAAVPPLVPQQLAHMSSLMRQASGYWAMTAPLGEDRYRFTFGRAEPTDGDDDSTVTPEEISTALNALYGPEVVLGSVQNASRFTDATRQVEQYRVGRVLFAGDAAHIHPPLGGQGLNLGVQDAFNLGWKLAAVLHGRAGDALLDSYHAERHPVGAQVIHHTSAQRVLADPRPTEDVAALRDIVIDLLRLPDANRHVAGLISGLSLRYDLPGEHPLTGQRLPDVELETGTDRVRLSTLFRTGHAVLLDLVGLVPTEPRLPPGVDLVRATCVDKDDVGAAAVLLRPDGYVCWAADTAGTAGTAFTAGGTAVGEADVAAALYGPADARRQP